MTQDDVIGYVIGSAITAQAQGVKVGFLDLINVEKIRLANSNPDVIPHFTYVDERAHRYNTNFNQPPDSTLEKQ